MNNEQINSLLQNLADKHECYLRQPSIKNQWAICWRKFKVGKDNLVGHVLISINPPESATEELITNRFNNALSTLKKYECKST